MGKSQIIVRLYWQIRTLGRSIPMSRGIRPHLPLPTDGHSPHKHTLQRLRLGSRHRIRHLLKSHLPYPSH